MNIDWKVFENAELIYLIQVVGVQCVYQENFITFDSSNSNIMLDWHAMHKQTQAYSEWILHILDSFKDVTSTMLFVGGNFDFKR